jgi:hypothetical protein
VYGSGPNEANPHIDLPGTPSTPGGALVRVDTALLQDSVPIVQALNAAINVKGNPGLTGSGALEMSRSNVTVNAPAGVWLNNSFLQIHSGPLLSLTGGTQMTVNGDFAYLTGGSRIFVNNGPMISVSGESAAGVASQLQVTGNLVTFGSGNNYVVINNNITPTATLSGIPVSATGTTITGVTASNIQIGANPIGNGGIQIGGSSPPPASSRRRRAAR